MISQFYMVSSFMYYDCTVLSSFYAQLIAEKRNERYSDVMNHLRTRLRFSLLKSILVAIRGARGKRTGKFVEQNLENVSFNLIPYCRTYEGY